MNTGDYYSEPPRRLPTLRDVALVYFRHQRLILITFCAIFLVTIAFLTLRQRQYQAETEILVRLERADPVVTPDSNPSTILLTPDATEEELNSEVELLQSRDLLQQVVIVCGLDDATTHSPVSAAFHHLAMLVHGRGRADLAVPRAVRTLKKKLKVEAIRKTNLVKVTYDSPNPELAARVLRTLTSLYLQKHLEVNRPSGTFAFFQQQSASYWNGLQAAEKRLAAFDRTENTVSAQAEKAAAQAKLVDFEADLRHSRIAIAATSRRIGTLNTEMGSTPNRTTTQVRTNSLLLQQLKATLLDLELKRTGMRGKYTESYVPERDLELQIEHTKTAIAEEEKRPLHDDTTDQNPTYQWMADDRAKAIMDLASLKGQAVETEQQIHAYNMELLDLDRKDLEQQDLIRAAKVQETNYLRYQNKREEARISDALDRKHIANVSVAESATTPALPTGLSSLSILCIGVMLGGVGSVSLAAGIDHVHRSLRDPGDVTALLEVPVLASFPKAITAGTVSH